MTTSFLRILATSDVHMHIKNFDYRTNQTDPSRGLERLAHKIDALRAEAAAQSPVRHCILLDNGDLLQGTALATQLAQIDAPNPLARVLSKLGYDALGLGNHDFDYGLEVLGAFAAPPCPPVLCSNLRFDTTCDWLQPHLLLQREELTIGVLSVLPPATQQWNHAILGQNATFTPILSSVEQTAHRLRAEGAQIVIALAHSGLGGSPEENALAEITASRSVDAVIGGHTHVEFPGPDHDELPGALMTDGTLNGVPLVMPGYGAEKLGCIDLDIQCTDAPRANVTAAKARLVPSDFADNGPHTAFSTINRVHQDTVRTLSAVVGHSDIDLTSAFSLVQPTALLNVIASAQAQVIEAARAGTRYADMPLISAVAPSRAGGRGGPGNFTHIPAGEVTQRHIADLLAYSNRVWAIALSGAEAREWLEKSASVFARLDAAATGPLLDPLFPYFDFDVQYGFTYEIDPTERARFDVSGRRIVAGGSRISALCYQGQPVKPNDMFLVTSTDYRLCGGGNFPGLAPDRDILRTSVSLDAALIAFFQGGAPAQNWPDTPWRFAQWCAGIETWFDTASSAIDGLAHLRSVVPGKPELLDSGFLRVPVTL